MVAAVGGIVLVGGVASRGRASECAGRDMCFLIDDGIGSELIGGVLLAAGLLGIVLTASHPTTAPEPVTSTPARVTGGRVTAPGLRPAAVQLR
jgi:hypothetical protein